MISRASAQICRIISTYMRSRNARATTLMIALRARTALSGLASRFAFQDRSGHFHPLRNGWLLVRG